MMMMMRDKTIHDNTLPTCRTQHTSTTPANNPISESLHDYPNPYNAWRMTLIHTLSKLTMMMMRDNTQQQQQHLPTIQSPNRYMTILSPQ